MGYELYRRLVTPSTPDKMNDEPEVVDHNEEEKRMELLIGK